MKTRILLAAALVCMFTARVSSQSQCSKGHFIFGTDIVQYSGGSSTYNGYENGKAVDTGKYTFSNISYGLNIWAGYFVSNRVCVGLSYNFGQSPIDYYFYPYYYDYYPATSIIPSSLFFRYYFLRADSGNFFDIGLEGNFGVQYNGTQNTFSEGYLGNSSNTSVTTEIDYLNLNTSVSLLVSGHISKHFAIQLIGGVKASYQSISIPSITTNPPTPNYNFVTEKTTLFTDMFTGSVRLQYTL